MSAAAIIIWSMALALGVMACLPRRGLFVKGIKIAWRDVYTMMPRIIMALLVSGFLSTIIPTDLVAAWLGKDAGIKGILIGSLVGGFTPGGPIISFPLVLILSKNGAGIPSLIAFLTAWSVFAFHRIVAYEIPIMGSRFMMVRLLSSAILPPFAGILAGFIDANLSLGVCCP